MHPARRFTVVSVLTIATACSPTPPPEIDWRAFDGNRAFAHAETLVGFGPRPSGSEALARQADFIATQLREFGLDAEVQSFREATPRGELTFRNVIGKTRGGAARPLILLAAHQDTKWMTNITFVGANDGASGVAVLLEVARLSARQPNLWFAFFDGEECVQEYGPNDGLHGSRHFVEELKKSGQTDRVNAMILLDMVGDARLNITMPADGDARLMAEVFEAARDTGHRDSFGYSAAPILDDHVPFLRAGIPAVDLIDFEFGSGPGRNDYWHTAQDTLDKISPRSLQIVGQTVLRLVSRLQNAPRH
jgi:Zn-dependent M28 family amino/carboxypeptidase